MDRSSTSSAGDPARPRVSCSVGRDPGPPHDTRQSPLAMKQDKSRVPALLAALLSFTAMLLALRCWTLSNESTELETQAGAIAEALQISVAAQDSCELAKAAAQRSEKRLLDELAKMRTQWEKLRGQVAQNKPRLEQGALCAAARDECSEQLLKARQSDETKADLIASLRTETQQLRSETVGLAACREQLKQTHAHLKHGSMQGEYVDENEAVHRDAIRRGAVTKRKKGSRPKKTRPRPMEEESVEEVRMVEDDMPTEMISDDEDAEVREVIVDDPVQPLEQPVERVADPRMAKKTTTTTTTELPLAADEIREEVESNFKTTTVGLRKRARVAV